MNVLWLGDSYGTGFQPTGGRVVPIPEQVAALRGWDYLCNMSVNASGYVESGDRYSFIQQVQNARDEDYDLIIIAGGRNDSSDNYSQAVDLYSELNSRWPNARKIAAFLWDSRWRMTGVQTNNFSNLNMLCPQFGVEFLPHAWAWFTGQDVLFCDNDIHPNAAGSERFAQFWAQFLQTGREPEGDCVLNLSMTGGCTGTLNIAIHDGLARLAGKWEAWPTGTTSNTTICYVPAALGRYDTYQLVLSNAGQDISFVHVTYDNGQGLLQYQGNLPTGGPMMGTCFMPPQVIDCGRVGQF